MLNTSLVNIRHTLATNSPQGLDFSSFLDRLDGLKCPIDFDPAVKALISQGNEFEIWTANQDFVYASANMVKATSFSIKQLQETPWSQLLFRGELYTAMIFRSVEKIYQTQRPVYDVTPWHLVTEIDSAKTVELLVKVEAMAPYWNHGDHTKIAGFIAVTKLKKPLN